MAIDTPSPSDELPVSETDRATQHVAALKASYRALLSDHRHGRRVTAEYSPTLGCVLIRVGSPINPALGWSHPAIGSPYERWRHLELEEAKKLQVELDQAIREMEKGQ